MKKINLNEYVYFKITPYGLKQLKKNHEELYSIVDESIRPKMEELKTNERGYQFMQLHEFMNSLGSFMTMGMKPITEKNQIFFDERDLRDE